MKSKYDVFIEILDKWKQGMDACSLFNLIEASLSEDKSDDEWPFDFWLIYMDILLELGRTEQFDRLIKQFTEKYGTYYPCGYLQIASKAPPECLHFKDFCDNINNYFKKQSPLQSIKALTHGKSVAIVGNSRGLLGQKNGKIIDSHDVVIRFNDYAVDNYSEDTGSKTNVWVRGIMSDKDTPVHSETDYDLTIYAFNMYRFQISSDWLSKLDGLIKNGTCFSYFPIEAYQLLKEYGVERPSSGILMFATLLLTGIKPRQIDFYGFSFLESSPNYSHYYGDFKWPFDVHNLITESKAIKHIRRPFHRLPREYRAFIKQQLSEISDR